MLVCIHVVFFFWSPDYLIVVIGWGRVSETRAINMPLELLRASVGA